MKNVSTGSGMINTSKGVLGLGEDLIKKHDILRSFSGTQKQGVEDMHIPDTGVHFYIGSLAQGQSGFYNEDFIRGSLDSMIKKLPNDTPIHLDMAGSVSILLNKETSAPTMEEQISHIKNIVNTDYKKYAHRIHIHNLADRHQGLLGHISENGIDGLGEESLEDSGSLYLAHKLYKATQENSKLLKKIISTKPDKLKISEPSDNDYYGLVEVAMRLQDLLDGISLQGGEFRQKRYDSIILDILSQRYTGSESLVELNNLISNIDNDMFQRLYFSKENYEKLKGEKRLLNIVRGSLLTTIASLGLLGYIVYDGKVSEDKRVKQAVAEAIEDSFRHKTPRAYSDFPTNDYGKAEPDKVQEIRKISKNVADQFIERYGVGNTDREFIQTLIINEFNRTGYAPQVRVLGIRSYESFIDSRFIPNNIALLQTLGIDIERSKDRKQFLKTYFHDGSGVVHEADENNIKGKGIYVLSDGVLTYELAYLDCYKTIKGVPHADQCTLKSTQDIFVARRQGAVDFSFDEGKNVAYDYLNNYVLKEYTVYMHNILRKVYDQDISREDITKKILRLQYEKRISMDDIRKQDFIQSISLIEQYFLENHDGSSSFESILKHTIDLDIGTLSDDTFYGTYIGAIVTSKNYTDYLYIIEAKGQKYLITFPASLGNISSFSRNSFKGSDIISRKILELL